ncbi:HD domain-containing protein [Thalassobacillus devorans]|uniref:HD domain-containing protein n=1 Tax=Thalassobacillus devorans TaxID=279813 RepID=UPI00048D5342|nr:HD domain-containing protein [Thalassobacillus devorans]
MNESNVIEKIECYVKELFEDDVTGHDYFHMRRVARQARELAEQEGADSFFAEAAGWLHDIGDAKLFDDPTHAQKVMNDYLKELNVPAERIADIEAAIEDVSFSKGKVPDSLEGRIVQDADRLDAIGAIGIARTFAFGGAKGQLIYDEQQGRTSIQHFYDKLLTLKDKMNTESARLVAVERHAFMEAYLKQFYREWYTE